ncbi:MAG: PQQ-binding-like beta-propeller repeat protein [Pseudomonadota bacterium]
MMFRSSPDRRGSSASRASRLLASRLLAGVTLKTPTIAVVAALGVSGCSSLDFDFLGQKDTIIEGERVALRQAVQTRSADANGVATFGPARSVNEWRQAGGAPNRALGHAGGDIGLKRVWSTDVGAGSDSESRITASPVAAGGRIFTLDAAAQVTAVDEQNGDRIWRTELAPEDEDGRDGFGGGLAVAGEFLVATTGFGEVLGLRVSNGEIAWRFSVGSPVRSAPNISQGLAVLVAKDGSLLALNVATGEEAWRVVGLEGGASMLSGGGSSPAIMGEIVAAPFSSGDISIFRLIDGRQGWSQPLGATRRGSAMAAIADVSSPPVISQGRIIAGSVSGRLVSFDIRSGRRVWARDLGPYNPVWAVDGVLFVISEDARLIALRAETGESIWETALPRYDDPDDREDPFAYGGPILVGGKLYAVSSDEKVFQVDAATGELLGEADISGPATNPPIAVNGRLIVLDDDGDLHAFQ